MSTQRRRVGSLTWKIAPRASYKLGIMLRMPYNDTVPIAEMIDAHFRGLPKGAQVAAAHQISVSDATISRWRRGKVIPEEFQAGKLAELLERSEDEVMAAISLQRHLRARPPVTARLEQEEWRAVVDERLDALYQEVKRLSEVVRRGLQQRGG